MIPLSFTFVAFALAANGQKPVIFLGGVVNAASYTTGGQSGTGLAPGSIVSIFGVNLATGPLSANVVPLPTQLGGTTVLAGGISAPIFFVSPGQINFQMPSSTVPPLAVVVSTAAGASDPYPVSLGLPFGIFTHDASGCGQGAALNIAGDGTVSVNSASHSASPGDYLAVFGTGLGLVHNNPPDGSPTPSNLLTPLSGNNELYSVDMAGSPLFSLWAGRAPGLIGVDQINLQVPGDTREGCAVPLLISTYAIGTGNSQPTTVSIHKGGGPCTDPPLAAFGQVTWQKTVATGTGSDGETDTLTVSLQASPGKQPPPPASFKEGIQYGNEFQIFGSSCSISGYRGLDAGAVTIQGPGLGIVRAPLTALNGSDSSQVAGLTAYRAVLSSGAIQPGSFSIAAKGGADVTTFQSSVQIGSDIKITGMYIPPFKVPEDTIIVNWTGGDSSSWVTLKVVRHLAYLDQYSFTQVRASDGRIGLETYPDGPVEIIVEVDPDPTQVPVFSAPGLSLGGQHTWRYVYRFGGITIQ